MSAGEWRALRDAMRARYAVHYSELEKAAAEKPADDKNLSTSPPKASGSEAPKSRKPRRKPDAPQGDIDIEPGPEW